MFFLMQLNYPVSHPCSEKTSTTSQKMKDDQVLSWELNRKLLFIFTHSSSLFHLYGISAHLYNRINKNIIKLDIMFSIQLTSLLKINFNMVITTKNINGSLILCLNIRSPTSLELEKQGDKRKSD